MPLLKQEFLARTVKDKHKLSEMALCAQVIRGKTGEDIKCPGKTLLHTQ
jgi:hypothetical protein